MYLYVSMYVCIYVCPWLYVCMYVGMYVCMCVCMYGVSVCAPNTNLFFYIESATGWQSARVVSCRWGCGSLAAGAAVATAAAEALHERLGALAPTDLLDQRAARTRIRKHTHTQR